MSTRNKAVIPEELKTFFEEIKQAYQPDPNELQRRIDEALTRYDATQKVQRFSERPPMLMTKLEELILSGWRFDISIPNPVQASPTFMSVALRKPTELIEKEIGVVRQQEVERYQAELSVALEHEIDALTAQAANDAEVKAQEQAIIEQHAMRERIRAFLTNAT
ncbi:hypothetical protein OS397_005552 [Serratia marcescens]|nr:hypothetical protein [Serratia marcescens]